LLLLWKKGIDPFDKRFFLDHGAHGGLRAWRLRVEGGGEILYLQVTLVFDLSMIWPNVLQNDVGLPSVISNGEAKRKQLRTFFYRITAVDKYRCWLGNTGDRYTYPHQSRWTYSTVRQKKFTRYH